MPENIETIDDNDTQILTATDGANLFANSKTEAQTVVPLAADGESETVAPLDLNQRFISYDPRELRGEFVTILDEMTAQLQTGDQAKLLGNNLMRKFRQAENRIRARLNGDFKLVVMGDFKRGKSTLVNALLEMNVATTNVTPETVTINEIEYGDELAAQACLTDGGRVSLQVGELEADTLLPFVENLERQNKPVDHIEIKAPVEWLRGVQLVDTPGMGDVLNRFDKQVQDYLHKADAIIFLVSAISPLSESEENFLRLSLKPSDFNRLIFVVNMLDFARTADESDKILNLITAKIGRLFPNAQVFGLSALDEICRLQNAQRPNHERAEYLAGEFHEFRQTLRDSILLDRDLIQLDRACGLLQTATAEIEHATKLLRAAMQQDQHKIQQAVTDLTDDNSALAQSVARHKKTMRAEIAKLGSAAEKWMSEFFDRLESETVGSMPNFKIEDVQKHFQFFLTDAIRDALNLCVEAHGEAILHSAQKARIAIDTDADNAAQISLENRQVAAATSANLNWTGFDTAASIFVLLGIGGVAEFIKIGGKLLFKDAQGKSELEHIQKHLQNSLPELRNTVRDEVRETYANIAAKLEAQLEAAYQTTREDHIAALEQAQAVKNLGEAQFADADQIFTQIFHVLHETRGEVGKLDHKIFPAVNSAAAEVTN